MRSHRVSVSVRFGDVGSALRTHTGGGDRHKNIAHVSSGGLLRFRLVVPRSESYQPAQGEKLPRESQARCQPRTVGTGLPSRSGLT